MAISTLGFPSITIPKNPDKLGVALVGLGNYSTGRLAPGLQKTEHCELRGIVTGSPHKIPEWQQRYGIPDGNVYNYDNMNELANNDDIDIIYVVTPPGLHARDSIAGAEAGKHVWCEKPMAMDEQECQSIIDACNKNRVHLTIGHRMQHEPNTQTIIEYGKTLPFGPIKEIRTGAGYSGGHSTGDWRRNPDLGGGALYDMGVYPINAGRYSTGKEPVSVSGTQYSEREDMYAFVDESTDFEMELEGGIIVHGETSFGNSSNYLEVDCEDGWYKLRPMQTYSGVQGEASDGTEFPPAGGHQQARQMDNDALAIKENKKPIVPGEDGLADIRVVKAIMESSRKDGETIRL